MKAAFSLLLGLALVASSVTASPEVDAPLRNAPHVAQIDDAAVNRPAGVYSEGVWTRLWWLFIGGCISVLTYVLINGATAFLTGLLPGVLRALRLYAGLWAAVAADQESVATLIVPGGRRVPVTFVEFFPTTHVARLYHLNLHEFVKDRSQFIAKCPLTGAEIGQGEFVLNAINGIDISITFKCGRQAEFQFVMAK